MHSSRSPDEKGGRHGRRIFAKGGHPGRRISAKGGHPGRSIFLCFLAVLCLLSVDGAKVQRHCSTHRECLSCLDGHCNWAYTPTFGECFWFGDPRTPGTYDVHFYTANRSVCDPESATQQPFIGTQNWIPSIVVGSVIGAVVCIGVAVYVFRRRISEAWMSFRLRLPVWNHGQSRGGYSRFVGPAIFDDSDDETVIFEPSPRRQPPQQTDEIEMVQVTPAPASTSQVASARRAVVTRAGRTSRPNPKYADDRV